MASDAKRLPEAQDTVEKLRAALQRKSDESDRLDRAFKDLRDDAVDALHERRKATKEIDRLRSELAECEQMLSTMNNLARQNLQRSPTPPQRIAPIPVRPPAPRIVRQASVQTSDRDAQQHAELETLKNEVERLRRQPQREAILMVEIEGLNGKLREAERREADSKKELKHKERRIFLLQAQLDRLADRLKGHTLLTELRDLVLAGAVAAAAPRSDTAQPRPAASDSGAGPSSSVTSPDSVLPEPTSAPKPVNSPAEKPTPPTLDKVANIQPDDAVIGEYIRSALRLGWRPTIDRLVQSKQAELEAEDRLAQRQAAQHELVTARRLPDGADVLALAMREAMAARMAYKEQRPPHRKGSVYWRSKYQLDPLSEFELRQQAERRTAELKTRMQG